MKRNPLTIAIGLLLLAIFVALLFCFQVRQTEVALVTTFGKPSRSVTEPGLNFKWPWPIQKVQTFDKRIQNLESKFEQTFTADKFTLIVTIYAGWEISDPAQFRASFGSAEDSLARAAAQLENIVRGANNDVVGQHTLANFISTDASQMKLPEIEQKILAKVQPAAQVNYGINVRFLGVKRLGLPESITEKIIARMKEERQRSVKSLTAEGDNRARDIASAAALQRDKTLAEARQKASGILSQADAEAQKSLAVLNQNPELGIFLSKIAALEESLTNRATLILDRSIPPFDLLDGKSAKPLGLGK
jgi:membrane protease subunit HflC